MAKETPLTKAMTKAHSHLMRGYETAWDRAGRTELGEHKTGGNSNNLSAYHRPTIDSVRDKAMPGTDKVLLAAKKHLDEMKKLHGGRPADPSAQSMSVSGEPSGAISGGNEPE